MAQTVIEYLENVRKVNDISVDDVSDQLLFHECIATSGEEVLATGHDERRWYTTFDADREIEDGVFVSFAGFSTTGDGNLWDYGCVYDLDKAKFVTKTTRVEEVTRYE